MLIRDGRREIFGRHRHTGWFPRQPRQSTSNRKNAITGLRQRSTNAYGTTSRPEPLLIQLRFKVIPIRGYVEELSEEEQLPLDPRGGISVSANETVPNESP